MVKQEIEEKLESESKVKYLWEVRFLIGGQIFVINRFTILAMAENYVRHLEAEYPCVTFKLVGI
jgi:hypothetical protein